MKQKLLLLFFLLSFNPSLFPQDTIKDKKKELTADLSTTKCLPLSVIPDQVKLWTSPLRWTAHDYCKVMPVLTLTSLAFLSDKNIQSNVQDFVTRNKAIKNTGSIITWGGSNIFSLSACGLLYFGGIAFKDDKIRQTGFLSAYALANTAVIITVLKLAAGRQRPNADNGNDAWHPLSIHNSHFSVSNSQSSFPSGHSAAAWTLATVISTQYSDKKWVAPVSYTLASAVSLSRITENRHWLSDAVMGSAIGYGIGKFIANKHKSTKWTLLPVYSKNNLLLAGIYKL